MGTNPGFYHANEECAHFLDEISDMYSARHDRYRSASFGAAAETVRTYPHNIMEMEDFQGLEGVGASINQEIKEYLETGTSERYQKLKGASK